MLGRYPGLTRARFFRVYLYDIDLKLSVNLHKWKNLGVLHACDLSENCFDQAESKIYVKRAQYVDSDNVKKGATVNR